MGPQSQRRNTLAKRTAKLKGSAGYRNKKKRIAKAGDQLTLTGEVAFDVLRHCNVCINRRLGKKELHRAHHKLCPNNRRTRGITSNTTLESNKYSKKWKKHFAAPLKQSEKLHSSNVTPRWQSSNPCQQSVPEQPQQQWIVAKPPIEPNFIYVPHTTATMFPTNQMPLPGFQWMPPQPTHQQQEMCLLTLPRMPPQPTQQQQEMCLLTLPRMPPQPTQQQMYSANTVTNGGFCCNKYFFWYISHNRKGRPPHDHQCLDRIQYKRDMRLGQETNSSI
ncbi:hypothetical protein IV203_007269 [Nitzschia inconspicua]|uniref:Uncharacterized protein n=1 Tax=Nitzschia inconspicua TaxID=303405 RepID=A0A9K3PC32_9STRA|nr:hypothetical protein IV203_007269 [Nitzschia inconspicua]